MTSPLLARVAADAVRREAANSHIDRVQKILNPFAVWRRPKDLGDARGVGSDTVFAEDVDGGLDCLSSRGGIVLVGLLVLADLAIPDPTICPRRANDNGTIHRWPASRATRGQHKIKGVPQDKQIFEKWVDDRLRLWQTDRFDILMLTNTEDDTPQSGCW